MALRLAVMSMWVYWREMASLSCPMMSRATASLTPAFLSILVAVCRKQWKLSSLSFRLDVAAFVCGVGELLCFG